MRPQGMVYPAAFARVTVMEVPVIATSYLPATTPLIRVFQSVATNSTSTPMSVASCLAASIWWPRYSLVSGSLNDMGLKSPVVPTLRVPLSRTL